MWCTEDPHLYLLTRAAASGSAPNDVLLHLTLRMSGVKRHFPIFFLSKNKHTLGSLGRKYNIHCGLSLLLHRVALQSFLVCTGRGVVHIRPDSEQAVVTSGFVPSYEDPTMASTVIFCKAGCVKSFSSSRSGRSTALFVIHVQTNSLLVAIQHNNLTLKALRETTRN